MSPEERAMVDRAWNKPYQLTKNEDEFIAKLYGEPNTTLTAGQREFLDSIDRKLTRFERLSGKRKPEPARDVFVFPSSLLGVDHSNADSKHAGKYWGAEQGCGTGRSGNAYAVPVKDGNGYRPSIQHIQLHLQHFVKHAQLHPEHRFFVSDLAADLSEDERTGIAWALGNAPDNVYLCMPLVNSLVAWGRREALRDEG